VFARLKDPVLALLQQSLTGQHQAVLEAGSVDDAVTSLKAAAATAWP